MNQALKLNFSKLPQYLPGETSCANQLTGFYMRSTLALNGLKGIPLWKNIDY